MREHLFGRRSFLGTVAGAAGVALVSPRLTSAMAPRPARPDDAPSAPDAGAVRLGIASYSLRKFPREKALEMAKALRTPYINLKSVHLAYDASDAEFAKAKQDLAAGGFQLVGGGTVTFDKDTDEGVERYFQYAKKAGMPLIVGTFDEPLAPRVEKFAKQYDIKVAIHNHGPEDKHFPSPYDVLKVVKNMDRRMGLCIDVGHTVRTGTDVVQAIADAGPRLMDMHVKDLRDLKVKESQCIVGEGLIPFPDIFRQLQAQRYPGYVNLEYEIDADDPLPGMKQSFAYMRGVLAGLAPSTRRGRTARA